MLHRDFGTKIQHLPYRGTAPAMQDLLAGRLDSLRDIAVTAVPEHQSRHREGAGQSFRAALKVLPDLPTAGERGFPWCEVCTYARFPRRARPRRSRRSCTRRRSRRWTDRAARTARRLAATLVAPDRRLSGISAGFVNSECDKWARRSAPAARSRSSAPNTFARSISAWGRRGRRRRSSAPARAAPAS